MGDLRFGVLGPLEVFHGDRPVRVPRGRRRAVLACLLTNPGQPVPVDALVEAGWGNDPPQDPRTALNTVVSRLRSVLGRDVIRSVPTGFVLAVPPESVDAGEFERLLGQAGAGVTVGAHATLRRALALWRGPAFVDWVDRPFASVEAMRLERLRLDTVESYAAASTAVGDQAAAIAALEEMLADQPFREHAVELLVHALCRVGRHTDALDRLRDHRRVLADELGLDPSPALRDLEAQVLGHDIAPHRSPTPAPPWLDTSTAFVGREEALGDLLHALETNRLVTVTGVGGVGKSRLAAEALPRLAAPTTVLELGGVSPGGLAGAVTDGLCPGPAMASRAPADAVAEHLGTGPAVLVLDGCEHLLGEVAELVTAVLRQCPAGRVLATSRRRLGIPTERVLPLEPLATRGDPTAGARDPSPAELLFADRVTRLRPSFRMTEENADDVREVCRRLDGLPLALELAASRAATLGVHELRQQLRAGLLDTEAGALHGVMDWSYRLLTAEQRRLLRCLSVFSHDVDLPAVRGLTGHLGGWQGDVVDAHREVTESSLITRRETPDGMRYRMLGLVRTFARQVLAESGEAEQAHRAHAAWVRDLTRELHSRWLRGDGTALDRVSAEVTAALTWALEPDARGSVSLALASSVSAAVMRCLHWTPGLALSELVTRVADEAARSPDPRHADGVAAGAFYAAERGDLEHARQLAHAAIAMAGDGDCVAAWLTLAVSALYAGDHQESATWFRRAAAEPELTSDAHASLALIACYGDDLASAREHAQVALAAGPSAADASLAFAEYAAGEVELRTDPDRGAQLLAAAAARADRAGAGQVSRVARVALLSLLARGPRHPEAAAVGHELLLDLQRLGVWPQLWTTLRVCAELLAKQGHPAEAATLLACATSDTSAPPPQGLDVERYAALRAHLDDRLGAAVTERIDQFAARLPRARVVDRAVAALETIRVGERGHTHAPAE